MQRHQQQCAHFLEKYRVYGIDFPNCVGEALLLFEQFPVYPLLLLDAVEACQFVEIHCQALAYRIFEHYAQLLPHPLPFGESHQRTLRNQEGL